MSRKTGRRRREETAGLIREAAVGLLRRDGLRGFSNSVRLDDALKLLLDEHDIRLTHGSVYGRIWVDQRDFQLDVVATTVSRYDGAEIATAMADAIAEADVTDRARPGPDLLASMFAAAVDAAGQSRMWNLWLAAHAAVVSTPGTEDDERLAGALAQAKSQVIASISGVLDRLTSAQGDQAIDPVMFLTQLVGASITRNISGATAIVVDALGSTALGADQSNGEAGVG